MSNAYDPDRKVVVDRLMVRLRDLVDRLGLDEAKAQQIVEQVIIDMPLHTDDERVEWARNWLRAAASAEQAARRLKPGCR